MSGRFAENDCDDTYSLLAAGRFLAHERTVFKSARGKALLDDMERALLALPERKLLANIMCEPRAVLVNIVDEGEEVVMPYACALGAFALYKGVPMDEMFDLDSGDDSIEIAQQFGMTFAMAWLIGDTNDSHRWDSARRTHVNETEAQRWQRVYDAVKFAQANGRWPYATG